MVIMKKQQKKSKGRQKIEIKPIKEKSNLQVTFSKRRAGLVKKASELSLLCGAQVAVLACSPGKKVFAFGHPNVDTVLDHYLNQSLGSREQEDMITNNPQVQKWNKEYEEALKELEEEKKQATMIEECKNMSENGVNARFWWDEPIDDMGLEELEEYVSAMQQLKRNVTVRANEVVMANHFSNQSMSSAGDVGSVASGSDVSGFGFGFGDGLF